MKIWCEECFGTGGVVSSGGWVTNDCAKCEGKGYIEATAKDIPIEIQREIAYAWQCEEHNSGTPWKWEWQGVKDDLGVKEWQGVKE